MSERIIVIVETIAVVILAIVVVIYAQVLWQRFQLDSQLQTDITVSVDDSVSQQESNITDENRMKVLEAISETSTNSATPEDRNQALETLTKDQKTVDAETRMKVLENLEGI